MNHQVPVMMDAADFSAKRLRESMDRAKPLRHLQETMDRANPEKLE